MGKSAGSKAGGGGGGGGKGKSMGVGGTFTSPTGFQTRIMQNLGESSEDDFVFRIAPKDIKRETDKAIGIDLGGPSLTFIPKSVIKGWYPGSQSGREQGFVVENWYARKNTGTGSPVRKFPGKKPISESERLSQRQFEIK